MANTMQMYGPSDDSGADTTGLSSDASSDTSGTGMGGYGAGSQAGGDFISSLGALYSGQSEAAALNAQSTIQAQNASLDLAASRTNAARSQILSGQRIGAIQAAAGASGVTQSGSVLSILAASTMNAEMDRQNILFGGQVKAIQAENQSSMDQFGAQSALTGSYFKAAGGMYQGGMSAIAAFA